MTRRALRVLFLAVALHACAPTIPRLAFDEQPVPLQDQTLAQQHADVVICEAAARDYMTAAAAGVEAQTNAAITNALVGALAGAAVGAATGAAVGGYAGYGAKVGTAAWGTEAALLAPVPANTAPSMLGYWNKYRLMRDLAVACLQARGYQIERTSVSVDR